MQFKWRVYRDGYIWIPSLDADLKRYVLLSRSADEATQPRVYEPFKDEPGLFRAFASTPCDRKDILNFANQYGRLGATVERPVVITRPGEPDSSRTGEPLHAWIHEILFMRDMVDLWIASQRRDEKALRKRLVWHKNVARYQNGSSAARLHLPPPPPYFSPQARVYTAQLDDSLRSLKIRGWVAHPNRDSAEVIHSLKSEWVETALYFLAVVVNQKLSEHTIEGPRLDFIGYEKLGWRSVPSSLIGFLWLQFAEAIAANRHFKQCVQCQRWFEVAQNLARADKLYCSQACRVRAYRARRTEAQERHLLGSTVDELAESFGSNVTTIKAWLNNSAGSKKKG